MLVLFLSFAFVFGCISNGNAASLQENGTVNEENLTSCPTDTSVFLINNPITRAYGDFTITISANSGATVGDDFKLNANDTISYDCTYTPRNASVDFGYIGPDGYFHFLNVATGSISKTFKVGQKGSYTLAIRNNSSQAVTGTVNY